MGDRQRIPDHSAQPQYSLADKRILNRSMKPEIAEISTLIQVANQFLLAKDNHPLEWQEEAVLKHVLAGEPLKTARAGEYSPQTIEKQIAPKLWKRFGANVRAKNVRLFLEHLATQISTDAPSLATHHSYQTLSTLAPADSSPSTTQAIPRRILHNLPQRQYTKFIGRKPEVTNLLKFLSPKHPAHQICLTGLGGVGKTSLSLACAWQCLHASCAPDPAPNSPIFDLIIFVTAKQQFLTYNGLQTRRDLHHKDLIRQIIEVLDRNQLLEGENSALSFEEQITLIYQVLENHRTLLIVDNLEAVENQQDISDFLCDLPSSVKTIITTREGMTGMPIRLKALSEEDGLNLVQHQAGEMGVVLSLADSKALYQSTGGLPLAIHLAIGQLTKGYSLPRVLEQLHQSTGNLTQYCFASSVQSIRNRPAYWLLLATVFFPEPALREALFEVAIPEVDSYTAEDELVQLQTLSLVSQENSPIEGYSRYRIIAPTRAYILSELQRQPQFEQAARERWLIWYLKFSENFRHQDPAVWQGKFEGLDQEWENLRSVADWCMGINSYESMLQLWRNLKPYFYMVGRGINCIRYWDVGSSWTTWLINAAYQRKDWQTAADALFFRAWGRVETDNPNFLAEASDSLDRAWDLREYQSSKDQANIARYIGWLKIKQREFTSAHEWLHQSDEILQQATLDDRKQQECLSHTRYYQGLAYFDAGNIEKAQSYFEEARSYAQAIDADRLVQIIEIALADTAIHQGKFERAQQLLDQGLKIAEVNGDRRQFATVKYLFAKLAKAQGSPTITQRYAKEALALFEQLGITTKINEVQTLMASIATAKKSQHQ